MITRKNGTGKSAAPLAAEIKCELTEDEMASVSGGATGRRIEKPIMITAPVGTASAII